MEAELAGQLSSHARVGEHARESVRRLGLRGTERRLVLFGADCLGLTISLSVAVALAYAGTDRGHEPAPFIWLALLLGMWAIVAAAFDCYDLGSMSRPRRSLSAAARAFLVTFGAYLAVAYVAFPSWGPPLRTTPFALGAWLVAALAALAVARLGYAALLTREVLKRRLAVLGSAESAHAVAELVRADASKEYELVGFFSSAPAAEPGRDGVRFLGDARDFPQMIRHESVHDIVLAHDGDAALMEDLQHAYESGVEVRHVSELFEELTGRIPVRNLGGHWLGVLPRRAGSGRAYDVVKRVADIVIAGALLVLLAPLMLLIALAIRRESPGPAIYRQEREGRLGRTFTMYKFRTMCDGAERDGPCWASRDDPRRTHLGRILRPTRLDELPQLANVLRGDMSLIGPRPERPNFSTELGRALPFYRARLLVAPGITGWAQVRFPYAGSVEDCHEKLQHDLYYVKHRSPLLDLVIALKTIGILLHASGR